MSKDVGELQKTVGVNRVLDVLQQNEKVIRVDGNNGTNGNHSVRSRNKTVELPKIVDIMDFLAEPTQLINGIFSKGSKLILSGGSKTRKTWALTHLAMAVATGQPWWGFDTTRARVLYVNFEIQKGFYQRRVKSIKDHLMIDGTKLRGYLQVWNLRGYAADITDLVENIIKNTKGKFDLIILDPIYKVLGDRDENSNGDIASMMNELDRIVEETGAAVAFAHHYSKGNQSKKNAMDRMSGAGAFARDADSLLMMTEHTQPDTYTIQLVLRNYRPLADFCVTVEHPIMVRNEQLDPSKLKAVNGSEKKYVVADLLKLLNVQQITRAELKRQFLDKKIASDGTFNKLFKEAQDTGVIELLEDGKTLKAVKPMYPPGFKFGKDDEKEAENGATVQE
jgi:hypothetical protein